MGKQTDRVKMDDAFEQLSMKCLQQDAMKFFRIMEICQGQCFGEEDSEEGFFPWMYEDDIGLTFYQPSFAMRFVTISNTSPDFTLLEKAFEKLDSLPEDIRKLAGVFVTDMDYGEEINETILPFLEADVKKRPKKIILRVFDDILSRIYDAYDPEWESKDNVHGELARFVKKNTTHDMRYYRELSESLYG